jgi:hypothetical protein
MATGPFGQSWLGELIPLVFVAPSHVATPLRAALVTLVSSQGFAILAEFVVVCDLRTQGTEEGVRLSMRPRSHFHCNESEATDGSEPSD